MKKSKSLILWILLLGVCHSYTYSQSGNDKDIFAKLKNFAAHHITEKVYLHFDKPYYATGDTIYFKAYVTMGERHDLSKLSGVLHVDLINTASKINQSIKLQLINGLAWGDFTLPDSLPKGNYRIRAYTQWMQNVGNYFEHTFPIGTLHSLKIPESSTSKKDAWHSKPDLQFFPEGGSLVMGINSKIAFKLIGSNGLGLDARGSVTDNLGNVVTQFASTHLGMGYFYLKPEEGKTYMANITFADGSKNTIDLPVPQANGIVLTINNDSIPNAAVSIAANNVYFSENKGKAYSLLIYSGGIATTVTCKLDSPVIKMDIIKRHLHTGVARVTLFSPAGEPLSERLLFIQNYDQLNLHVGSDKTTYSAREKVTIKVNAKTRADSSVIGHFSVAVIDESKVPVDEAAENTILTDLLLTSDLKGTVEQPNYYFTSITDETNKNLDLVMLTHGYRKFEWKQVLNDTDPPIAFQPEKGLEITGTAKSLLGKPLAKATVSLISVQSRTFASQVTDNQGNFRFDNLVFMDSSKFILQAVNAKGKNTTKLIYDEETNAPVTTSEILLKDDKAIPSMSTYLQNSEKQQEEIAKRGSVKGKMLKEVKIKGFKDDNDYPSSNLGGPGHADQVVHRADLEKTGGSIWDKLAGKFHGPYGFEITSGSFSGLIVVDGIRYDRSSPNIDAENVETVELLYGANASIYGMGGGHGVLVVTTRVGSNEDPKDIASTGILPIIAKGYYKAREFYSPKYESDTIPSRADLRSTIYWNQELITDKDGNVSFTYYNSDGHGTYRLVIEGIDEKGNLGRQVFKYTVE
ncbi:MAG: TonB-dependent receptor [Mucilaginibacter sp.]